MVCELVHESAGPRIADVELALHEGYRCVALCRHHTRSSRKQWGEPERGCALAQFEIGVGRRGLEPRTSALLGLERSATEVGSPTKRQVLSGLVWGEMLSLSSL
jgi:hypothetical protein